MQSHKNAPKITAIMNITMLAFYASRCKGIEEIKFVVKVFMEKIKFKIFFKYFLIKKTRSN